MAFNWKRRVEGYEDRITNVIDDNATMLVDDVGNRGEEFIQQMHKLCGMHAFGEAGEPLYVGEQQGRKPRLWNKMPFI